MEPCNNGSGCVEAPLMQAAITLLTLPGEIRNRIYMLAKEFCVPITLHHNYVRQSDHVISWSECRPSSYFWALTQVCRQLRREFLPIYLHNTSIRISVTDAERYISTFYPALNCDGPDKEDQRWQGNLVIEMQHFFGKIKYRVTRCKKYFTGSPSIVDITKLIDFKARATNVHCHFTYDGHSEYKYIGDLHPLLDGKYAATWLQRREHNVKSVRLSLSLRQTSFGLFEMKARIWIGLDEEYKDRLAMKGGRFQKKEFKRMMRIVGLDGSATWKVRTDFQTS